MAQAEKFSIKDGYSFVFDDDGRRIRAWFCAWSGHEKILVDGKPVVEKKNYSRHSCSDFKAGVDVYAIDMYAASVLFGPYVCTLSKNGKPFKRQKLCLRREQGKDAEYSFLLSLGHFAVLAIMLAFAWIYFDFTIISYFVTVASLLLVILLSHLALRLGTALVIEDEEIAETGSG